MRRLGRGNLHSWLFPEPSEIAYDEWQSIEASRNLAAAAL
jgi:hypothetical protein